MIEQSLLKSNFVGRDGFRWWIGQIAPEDCQGDQINQEGSAWGNRIKVRIMGYHPQDLTELKNVDLPWAQVLLPTTAGSGGADRFRSIRLSPGDSVFGFFLDGDDAQLPVIVGLFGRTKGQFPAKDYSMPFAPFTGYTSKIKNDGSYFLKTEVGEQSGPSSQPLPVQLPDKLVKKLNEKLEDVDKLRSTHPVIGKVINLASNESSSAISEIKDQVGGLVDDMQGMVAGGKISELTGAAKQLSKKKIGLVTDKLAGLSGGLAGSMMSSLTSEMGPKLNGGLKKLYKGVFATVFAATKSRSEAKKAGAKAQAALINPLKDIENGMPCIMQNIVGGLKDTISGMLNGLLDNVKNFVSCIGDQFIGGLMNQIIGGITKGLGPLLGGIGSILGGFSPGDFLRSKAEALLNVAKMFECETPPTPSSQEVTKWGLGKGPVEAAEIAVDKILSVANTADKLTEGLVDAAQGLSIAGGSLGVFDFMNPSVSVPKFKSPLGECYGGPPLKCAGVKVKIFGSDGVGANARAILGNRIGTGVEAVGSLIGIDLKSGGSGYNRPPFVEITDECGQGYGGVARAVIDYDEDSPTYQQITDIYVVSEGENYPIKDTDDEEPVVIDRVTIVNPGFDYSKDDVVTDDDGNEYTTYVDNMGRIVNVIPPSAATVNVKEISKLPELKIDTRTGYGAILKPRLGERPPYQGEVKQVIDCIS